MRAPLLLLTLALLGLPAAASAHTGSALDADGCHVDHRDNTYHCHRGDAAGYTFPNRAAMEEAVRTGNFPEKTVETDSFLSKLWPFGGGEVEEEEADEAAAAGAAGGGVPAAKPSEAEERLKVLQGLYEMGLITKDEYEAKRKAVLDQL